ncbi:hypothetical protein, partial [Actinophytocola sp.]|uniref:hypothetical protein n=1 Tax=Actinophytocola sp. TaxID=1872138 RepID=UPI003D6C6C70
RWCVRRRCAAIDQVHEGAEAPGAPPAVDAGVVPASRPTCVAIMVPAPTATAAATATASTALISAPARCG